MSITQKTVKMSELLTTEKTAKTTSEDHKTVEMSSLEDKKMYPGPQLTRDKLKQVMYNPLRLPENGHVDYSYIWLSMDNRAQPNYYDAVGTLGYTSCTVAELPEMEPYVQNTMDGSLHSGKIVYKEMVLCKIHKQDRLLMLEENHHYKPLEMARDVYRRYNDGINAVNRKGSSYAIKARRDGEFTDNVEERFVNSGTTGTDESATGIITNGRDVQRVRPKFII